MLLDYVKRKSDQNTFVCTYTNPSGSVKAASITRWNLHWCQAQSSAEQNIAQLGSCGVWLPFKQVERSTNETLVSGDPRAKESMDWNDNARVQKSLEKKRKSQNKKANKKPTTPHTAPKPDKNEAQLGCEHPGQARKLCISQGLNGKMILVFLFVFRSWTFSRRKSTLVLE